MTNLSGANVLVTGGAGTIGSTLVDQLLEAGVAHVDVLDNLVRGRRANLAQAFESGQVTLIEGDLRDRDLVHDLTKGKDVVCHQAALRITQCAEEPRLALEVLVDGTFTVHSPPGQGTALRCVVPVPAVVPDQRQSEPDLSVVTGGAR